MDGCDAPKGGSDEEWHEVPVKAAHDVIHRLRLEPDNMQKGSIQATAGGFEAIRRRRRCLITLWQRTFPS